MLPVVHEPQLIKGPDKNAQLQTQRRDGMYLYVEFNLVVKSILKKLLLIALNHGNVYVTDREQSTGADITCMLLICAPPVQCVLMETSTDLSDE